MIFRRCSASCSCTIPSCIGQARYMIIITIDSHTTDRCIFSSNFTSCAIEFNGFSCASTNRYTSQTSKIFIQGIGKLTFILINCKIIPCYQFNSFILTNSSIFLSTCLSTSCTCFICRNIPSLTRCSICDSFQLIFCCSSASSSCAIPSCIR